MMIGGAIIAMGLLFVLLAQSRSLCAMEGKIPKATGSKAGQFHFRGDQLGQKAKKSLAVGIQAIGPLDFPKNEKNKAANRKAGPARPSGKAAEQQNWKGDGPLPRLPGDWCSITDEPIGDKTLTTVANFTRGEEGPGGFSDEGTIWVGIIEAFDIARIDFQRTATYDKEHGQCLEWIESKLTFTLAFNEWLTQEQDVTAHKAIQRFEENFMKMWKPESLNEVPCQPMEYLSKEHILVKDEKSEIETHTFRCQEEKP